MWTLSCGTACGTLGPRSTRCPTPRRPAPAPPPTPAPHPNSPAPLPTPTQARLEEESAAATAARGDANALRLQLEQLRSAAQNERVQAQSAFDAKARPPRGPTRLCALL